MTNSGPDRSKKDSGPPPPLTDAARTDESSVLKPVMDDTIDHSTRNRPAELEPVPGELFLPKSFGRYEVRGVLGMGGFGAVYRGYDTSLRREVAIKVPRLIRTSSDTEERFLQEARQLAQLRHPGIVSVYDVGSDQGICYIVTDFLNGVSLSKWLRDHSPTWQESAGITAAIADALSHAHAQRIVHRDLKPANVIMLDGQRPVLVDFGLAISDAAKESDRGTISGTPGYMSPEQAGGEGHRIDGRTDIYSLGVVLYYMLTSRLPCQSVDYRELLREIQEDEPQPPRQLVKTIPRELERICLKALAKKLNDRYTTAGDLAEELRQVLSGGSRIESPSLESAPLPSASSSLASSRISQMTPPSASPSSRRGKEAERRRITIWQCGCELFRSEQFLESLDPEEQHELLLAFQKLCQDVIEPFRGTVVKTTDRGMQVCFGFPIAFEDAAASAVRAGVELLDRMSAFNAGLSPTRPFQFAAVVAVHSDLAVVQEKDHSEEKISVVGSILSLVDQIETLAAPGSVLISDDTYRLVKGRFECAVQGTHRLKGTTSERPLHLVIKERSPGSRVDIAELAGLTPLIGRDREVGLLQERWDQAAEGIGQTVLLIGEAGIGKSRLIHGLKEFVMGQNTGPAEPIIEWRTSPHHQNSSLYPAVECFERLLGIDRKQTPAEKLTRVQNYLNRLGMGNSETAALLASLLSIPGDGVLPPLRLTPQKLKEKTLDFLVEWLRANSRRQPMLFVVEDLHWVDPTTLELLAILLDEASHERLLTLFTFRPEFMAPWRNKSHLTQIVLNRLTKRQIGEMMLRRSKLKSIPQRLIDQVIERTDGVPLFVEEFTNTVLASGKVREVDGNLEISESFPLNEIPATLQDLLMARLDRMASNIEVVQLASALGREFSYELLQKICPLGETALQAELTKLVEAELLFQRGRLPSAHYQFKHALIQDAAYQSVLRKKRQQFHQRIGRVLETDFPETCAGQPELLAHHFAEANVPAKAVEYWSKAGSRSLERCGHREAIEHLTRALDLIKTVPESPERQVQEIQIHISLGVPLQATRGYSAPEVESNYARAHELCQQLGATAQVLPVLYGLFRYYMLQARYEKALELAEQLRVLAEQTGNQGFIVAAHRALGATYLYRGDTARSLEHLQKVLSIEPTSQMRIDSYRYDVVDLWITSRSYLAWVLWLRGYPDSGLVQAEQAIAIARGLEHPFSLTLAWSFASWLHQFRHEVEAVAAASEQAVSMSKERGYAFWSGWSQIKRGWVLGEHGRFDEAIAEIIAGLRAWRAQGSELGISYYLTLLAEIYGKAGQIENGLETLNEAQQFADSQREGFWLSEIHRTHGELLLLQHEDAGAEACFQQALDIARRQEAKSLELRAATSLARLWVRQGRSQDANALLTPIIACFNEGLHSHDVLQAQAVVA